MMMGMDFFCVESFDMIGREEKRPPVGMRRNENYFLICISRSKLSIFIR